MNRTLPTCLLTIALAGGVLAGCTNGGAASTNKAKVSAAAANPTVRADEARAAALVKPCVATGHIATAESCLRALVPPAQRHAFGTCLSEAALKGWASLKATGAQACLVKSLPPATVPTP